MSWTTIVPSDLSPPCGHPLDALCIAGWRCALLSPQIALDHPAPVLNRLGQLHNLTAQSHCQDAVAPNPGSFDCWPFG